MQLTLKIEEPFFLLLNYLNILNGDSNGLTLTHNKKKKQQ